MCVCGCNIVVGVYAALLNGKKHRVVFTWYVSVRARVCVCVRPSAVGVCGIAKQKKAELCLHGVCVCENPMLITA